MEEATQGLGRGQGESGRGGVVVGELRLLGGGEIGRGTARCRERLGWVVVELGGEELEADRDGLVAQVGLVEPEAEAAGKIADVGFD